MSWRDLQRGRRDNAEPSVIEALQALGFVVSFLSQKNRPDLLVSRGSAWYVIEVKTGKGKEKPGQVAFRTHHAPAPVPILTSVDDVLAWERGLKKTPGLG